MTCAPAGRSARAPTGRAASRGGASPRRCAPSSRRRRLSKWFTVTRGRAADVNQSRKPCVFSSACLETHSPDVILSRTQVKRNCSMSPAGLAKVYAALAAVVLVIGAGFATVGAWLVLPFAGLEVLLLVAEIGRASCRERV